MTGADRDLVTVETSSQWETGSLLRRLQGFNAYAIQISRNRWIVRGRASVGGRSPAALRALVDEWAAEQQRRPLVVRAADYACSGRQDA